MLSRMRFLNNELTGSNRLTRSMSSPNLTSFSFDANASLVIKNASSQEISHAAKSMKLQIEKDKWMYLACKDEKLDDNQKKWNNRIFCTTDMCETCINVIQDIKYDAKHQHRCFIAYYRGVPVGIEIVSYPSDPTHLPEIVVLVTHCGLQGGGILMVEYAADISQNLGREGVRIYPMGDSEGVYLKMGFEHTPAGDMVLKPARSRNWGKDKNGRYRFLGQ
ncbi:N-acetyltransferase [Xenorhabdus beddingii]|uniref:N-acetyltransferase n=1 Tax=Xenorhabdus beddingii TaxID=40578 RepID=A0A1Y2SJG9_9GAMM|nr:GNAT family N-acetyltransferase [Xenorhabdus beddingii]OTA18801.1 N-acetyltransferase [Xenorhabdus beddingii]